MDAQRIEHLKLIQAVVNRLATNSLECKKWSVALTSALLGWATLQSTQRYMFAVAFIPAVVFWLLDAYYLHQERLFRDLYDQTRLDPNPPDFAMRTPAHRQTYAQALCTPCTYAVHIVVIGLCGALTLSLTR